MAVAMAMAPLFSILVEHERNKEYVQGTSIWFTVRAGFERAIIDVVVVAVVVVVIVAASEVVVAVVANGRSRRRSRTSSRRRSRE